VESPAVVLVVEDDRDIRDSVLEILRDEGYLVRGFANGAEALAHLRSGGCATLILLDVMMPVMDGWELHGELQADPSLASIPVVLLTADDNARSRAASMKITDSLSKPVRLDDLLDAVRRHGG
jgi:CheY-like chemotaxis protein